MTDFESTQTYASSGEYLDLCSDCRHSLPTSIAIVERADLDQSDQSESFDDILLDGEFQTEKD